MQIKEKKGQLVLSFQEGDACFELGYFLLEQSKMGNTMPMKRSSINGYERMTFFTDGFVKLGEVLPQLYQDELIDILYVCVHMTSQVEENGFLKRNCIWSKFEHVFYDKKAKRPVFLMLPVCGNVSYADGLNWERRFLDTVSHITAFLPQKEGNMVMEKIVAYLKTGEALEETLEAIEALGDGKSGLLVCHTQKQKEKVLILRYSGREGVKEYEIKEEEYVLGKLEDMADGVISLSDAVSRVHCKIVRQKQQYFVQDLDSTNHTFVNGEYIPPYELMELQDNDILSVADVDFRVHIKDADKRI